MVAYAVDQDFARISARIAASPSPWDPWYWTDDNFSNGKDIAAARLEDGRQLLAVTNASNGLFLKWQQALDGAWAATEAMSPAPPAGAVRVAATGEPGARTQLFVTGTDNRIYTTAKGAGANSAWQGWCDLSGAVAGLNAVAVKRIGNSQFIVWSGSGGTRFRWTNSVGCSGWTFTETLSSLNYSALGLGVTANGRLHLVYGSTSSGTFYHRYRDLGLNSWGGAAEFPLQSLMDLSSCSVDTQFPTCPPYYSGFRTFASGVRDGREVILAVTWPNGEMFTTRETVAGTFENWTRFYK